MPPGRFGVLDVVDNRVTTIREKPETSDTLINGGFFVLEPDALSLIESDETIWERQPLEQLASGGQLMTYQHKGFWQPMDTLREKRLLEDLWSTGQAPWKVWP
jgi:glucose-1-phosphate cytidylyltransferase